MAKVGLLTTNRIKELYEGFGILGVNRLRVIKSKSNYGIVCGYVIRGVGVRIMGIGRMGWGYKGRREIMLV